MALQGSGAISLYQIQAEFGGANPISLSEYYRGGAYVGSSATSVPTGGAISMSNFYGTSAVSITINGTMTQVRQGSSVSYTYRSRAVPTIQTSNGATPSSYAWSLISDDTGQMFLSGANLSQATLNGPSYDINSFGLATSNCVLQCVVVLNGVQVSATRQYTYTYDTGFA